MQVWGLRLDNQELSHSLSLLLYTPETSNYAHYITSIRRELILHRPLATDSIFFITVNFNNRFVTRAYRSSDTILKRIPGYQPRWEDDYWKSKKRERERDEMILFCNNCKKQAAINTENNKDIL
jgi:hypothetical protein